MPREIIQRATDLLTLERLTFELRLPPESLDDSERDALTDIITDAVDAVRVDSNVPVLPEMASVILELWRTDGVLNYTGDPYAFRFFDNDPLRTASSQERAFAGVYDQPVPFTPANQPSDDTAPVGALTGFIPGSDYRGYKKLYYWRGLLTTSKIRGDLRSMSILRARAIFDGVVSVPERSRSAYERLLERVRFEGLLPESFESLGPSDGASPV